MQGQNRPPHQQRARDYHGTDDSPGTQIIGQIICIRIGRMTTFASAAMFAHDTSLPCFFCLAFVFFLTGQRRWMVCCSLLWRSHSRDELRIARRSPNAADLGGGGLDLWRRCCARQERARADRAEARFASRRERRLRLRNEERALRFRTFTDFHFRQPSERSSGTARSTRAMGERELWGAVSVSQLKSKSPKEVHVYGEVYEQGAHEKHHCSDRGIGRRFCITPCIRAASWHARTAEPACRQSHVRCAAAVVYAAWQ